MSQLSTPEAKDWDNFWSLDQTEKFTKISWSKKRIMSILNRYVKKDGYALDAGCGSGFFSKYFCDMGMNTVSCDYAKEALDIAKRITNNRSELMQADLCDKNMFKSVSKKFDLIFTDGLFEHFSYDTQDVILGNFIELLNDDGVIVTFVPNKFSPWELIRPLYMPGIDEKPFTLQGLTKLQDRSDLKIIEKGGINTFPFAISPDKLVGSTFGMLLYTIAKK